MHGKSFVRKRVPDPESSLETLGGSGATLLDPFVVPFWGFPCTSSYCFVAIKLQYLRNSLPDQVVVQRIEGKLYALGKCIACNDDVALSHTYLERETEEIV
ncbi:hypothetical protein NE237_002782 [Protea cynaroides]|uniref:Uncharacterized protein n=1 Tax=Protea cynaroides TaxID=273540 RepID=A0A9Q0KFM0_9MAGN|nr:hypothetical protein NE237_002782 [Protea cynaroides]